MGVKSPKTDARFDLMADPVVSIDDQDAPKLHELASTARQNAPSDREPYAAIGLTIGGVRRQIPAPVQAAILRLLDGLGRSEGVTLLPCSRLVTSTQAARLLGWSRPYLVRVAEERGLHSVAVGTHHRFDLAEVLALRAEMTETFRGQRRMRALKLHELNDEPLRERAASQVADLTSRLSESED